MNKINDASKKILKKKSMYFFFVSIMNILLRNQQKQETASSIYHARVNRVCICHLPFSGAAKGGGEARLVMLFAASLAEGTARVQIE